jgi:Restriction endonuclease BglII
VKIAAMHSHQNGWEFIKVHKPALWTEIEKVIAAVDATKCKSKVSKEKRTKGDVFYSPIEMNKCMMQEFSERHWKEQRTSYWVTEDSRLIEKTMKMSAAEQKQEIESAGRRPIFSYNQTDFVKDRIAVEVQFGKYSFVAYDLLLNIWPSTLEMSLM